MVQWLKAASDTFSEHPATGPGSSPHSSFLLTHALGTGGDGLSTWVPSTLWAPQPPPDPVLAAMGIVCQIKKKIIK